MNSKTNTNRQWLLKSRPTGMVSNENFELVENPIPVPQEGEILAKMLYYTFEPAMRGWLNEDPGYMPPIEIGQPVTAPGLAEVIESNNPKFEVGSLVSGLMSWSEYITGTEYRVADKDIAPEMLLGPLGGTGLTAYAGLLKVGAPKAGDTVLVSGAAGATGSVAAQIARIMGCRTIGIAGGEEKCNWLINEAKLDGVIDYKSANISKELHTLCPDGVDVYFENVGGKTLEIVLNHLAIGARIALCGMISQYNSEIPEPGPNNIFQLIMRRAKIEGFMVFDYMDDQKEALENLTKWVKSGEIAFRSDVQEGFLNIPDTFFRLYSGKNQGKQLLKL